MAYCYLWHRGSLPSAVDPPLRMNSVASDTSTGKISILGLSLSYRLAQQRAENLGSISGQNFPERERARSEVSNGLSRQTKSNPYLSA
jgi:hypothetical protein